MPQEYLELTLCREFHVLPSELFQYPLFRIVDCFRSPCRGDARGKMGWRCVWHSSGPSGAFNVGPIELLIRLVRYLFRKTNSAKKGGRFANDFPVVALGVWSFKRCFCARRP